MRKLAFPILVFSISLGAQGATILVPAHQPTIQAAINAAASGDTIEIAAGTYVEDLWIPGSTINSKDNLTIQPVAGAQVTIEAANVGRTSVGSRGIYGVVLALFGLPISEADKHGFIIEGDGTTLRGLTILNEDVIGNSFVAESAAVLVCGDDTTIDMCTLRAPTESNQVLYVHSGNWTATDALLPGHPMAAAGYSKTFRSDNLTVSNTIIQGGNPGLDTVDGAVWVASALTGDPSILANLVLPANGNFVDVEFRNNGHLASVEPSNWTYTNCHFTGNNGAFFLGGGIQTFNDCAFEGGNSSYVRFNSNVSDGGGKITGIFNNCLFCGGANSNYLCYVAEGDAVFNGCIFNVTATSPSVVAGIQYSPGDIDSDFSLIGMPAETHLTIDHCDFFSPDGRGVYADDLPAVGEPTGNLSIMNSILVCAEPVAFASVTGPSIPNATIQYNDLFTGATQISNPLGSWNVTASNNLNEDPGYVDASACAASGYDYTNPNLLVAGSTGGPIGSGGWISSLPTATNTRTPTDTLPPTSTATPLTPTPSRTPNPACPNPIFVSGGTGLQAAINSAQPGCTIEIQDSLTYNEDIYIPPSKPFLTIRAAAGQTPTIKAVNTAHHRGLFGISHVMLGAPNAPDHLGVIIEAEGTALQGLILVNDGPGNAVFNVSSAATVAADGVSFQNCTIRGAANTISDNGGLLILTGDWSEFETRVPGAGFVSAGYSTIRCDDLTVVDCLFDRAAIELASVDYATTLGLTIGTFYNPVIHPRDGTFFRCTFTGGDEIAQNSVGTGFLYLDCDFHDNSGEFTQEGGSAYFVDCRFSRPRLGSGLLYLRADTGLGGGVADVTATNCLFCGGGGVQMVDIDEGNAVFQNCIFSSTDTTSTFSCIQYNPESYDNDFFYPLFPPSLLRPSSLTLVNCDLHNPFGVGVTTSPNPFDLPNPPGSIRMTDTIIVANEPVRLLNPSTVVGSIVDIQYNDLFVQAGWTEVTPGAWSGVIANNLHEDPAYEDPSQCDPAGFLYHNATLATAGMSGGPVGAVGFSGVGLTPTPTVPSPTPTPTSTCGPAAFPGLNPACAGASPLSENFDVWPDFLPLPNGFRNFDVAPLGPDPGNQQEEFILFGLAEEPSCGPAKVTISPHGIVRSKSNVYLDDLGAVVDMQGAAAAFYGGAGTGFGWNTHVDSDPETGQYVVGQHYNNDPGYAFPNTLATFDYIQSSMPPTVADHAIFQRFDRYGNKVSNLTAARNIPSTVSHTELPYFPQDLHGSRMNGVSILSDGNTLYSIVDRSRSGYTVTDVGVVEYFRDHGIVPNLNSGTHRCNVHTVTTPDASGFVVSTTPTFVDPATGLTTDSIAYQGVDAGEGFFAVRNSFMGGTLAVFRNNGSRIAQIFNYNALIVSSGLLPYPNDGTLSLSTTNTLSCSDDTIYMTALYRPQPGGVLRPCVLRFRVDNLQTVTPLPVIAGYEDSVTTLDYVSASTMDVFATPEGDFALAWREGVGDGGAPAVRVFNQDGTPATSSFYPSSLPSPDMDIAYSQFSNSNATIKVALHDNTLCVVWLSENGVPTVNELDCGGQPKLPALSTVARLFYVPVCQNCPPPPPPQISLAEALDNYDLTWTTGGDAPWFGVAETTFNPNGETSFDGFDAARSGDIHINETSFLQTEVVGPGMLGFHWRVSSETSFDFLEFHMDDSLRIRASGESGWHETNFNLGTGSHMLRWSYRKDGSVSSGRDTARVDQITWTELVPTPTPTASPIPTVSLPEALDNFDLTWTTGGDAPWFGVAETTFNPNGETSFDGFDAARSGDIHNNETSFLQAEVVGPGTIGFHWRVSSETPFDFLGFFMDGSLHTAFSGESGWQETSFDLGTGVHELTWFYWKNGSVSSGMDTARVDLVTWTEAGPTPTPTATPAPTVSLPEALDNFDLTWTTGGDAPWFGVGETTFNPNGETSFDGFDAARSGDIHDNETSFLQTEVVGPGTAGFYWKLSSETPFDTLEFYVDDAPLGQFSGEIPWHPASIEVTSGPHTLKAIYSKNGSGSSGADAARLDQATWTPGPPPPVSCPIYVSGGTGLQAAINAATAGCVIEIVDSLTYVEDLYIPPSKTNLTIRAATGETPTIRSANTTGGRGLVELWFQLVGASGAPDHAGLIVEGNGTTLLGLTLENDGATNAAYGWNSAILVMADNVTLEACTIRGSAVTPGDRVGLLVISGDWTSLEGVTGPIFTPAGYGITRCDNLAVTACVFDRGAFGLATVDYANAIGLLLTGQTHYNPVIHPQGGSFTNSDFTAMSFAANNAVGQGFVYQNCNFLENDASFQQEGGSASFTNCRFSRSFPGQELFAVQADLGYGGGVADVTCTNCTFCGGRMEMVEVTTGNAIFERCVFTNEEFDPTLPCILYNPEEFVPEFYTLPAPFEGARPTSLVVDHCDFHIPNSIAIGTNAGPYDPPHPPSSLQVTNSNIVANIPINIVNATFVPGTTLNIQYNNLFTSGTQVVNTSGWPGTIANNLNVDPHFVDPNRCDRDGFLYANSILGTAASDGGPIGSQGRWPIGGLADTDQPMLGGAPQHTGFTDRLGPETEPEILWEAAPGLAQAAFGTQAILDGNGNIYVDYGNVDTAPAPRQENLISFDSSGLERWRSGPISGVLRFGLSTAALNLGGQIIAAFRDNYARSFSSAAGTLNWETPVQGSLSPPAVDRFGFIYVSGAKLDPQDGSILWQFPGGTNSAMALSLDERTVYFGQSETLYALEAGTGNVNWSFSPSPAARFGYVAPVVGADGTVYLSERTTGDFFAFEDNGHSGVVKWVFPTNLPGDSPRRAGLDQDTVYLGTVGSDVVLHAMGLDGVQKWSREFPSGTYVGDPCITDAAVYITVDSEGGLYALDRDDGSLLWRRQVSPPGASFSEGVTLTDNGILYVGTSGTLAHPDQAVLVALQASSAPCLAVTLPEALNYPRGTQVIVPIEVESMADLSAITDLVVNYDPSLLSLPTEDRVSFSPLFPEDWLIFANTNEPGVVRVSGTGITPASGSGTLITLTFDVIGDPGSCAPIFLSVGSFEDSNGGSICTNTNDGWFCVTSEGTVMVEVEPDAGSWTLTGPEGFAPRTGSGDQAFSNAPVGSYSVAFDTLPGYIAPPPASGDLNSLGVLTLSGTYTPTGSVSVEVEPDSASWIVTGPAGFAPHMGAGDETIPNVPVGIYQVVFDPLPNHISPPSASGELVAFGSLILSGTYTPTGTVNVEVEPNSATWTLSGPVGFTPYSGSSDVSVPDAPAGNYSVAFDPLPGYLTPASANGSLAPFGSLILSGTYTPTGVVSVQVEPDAAGWTLTGPAGFAPQSSSGDQSFSDVPEGIYSLAFDPLPGYISPPSATGELTAFGALILSGTYTPTGAVTVQVDPDTATWTLTGPAGFTPQFGAGNQTLPGVPVGTYTATFDPLPEYITPHSASGELTAFGALILSGTYTPTGTITVEVDPDGATWTLTGPALFGSHSGAGDETIEDAPVGDYQMVFHAVSDYITPASDSGVLAASQTLAFSGVYTPLLDISGRVAYCHDLVNKPVPDATLELSPGWFERTDSSGLYAFESLPAGISYAVTATRAIQPGDVAIPSITAFDASLILRHTVGLVSLNACQLIAADVNRSNTVTAFDASQILRFTVGLIPAPFVWLIEPDGRIYAPLLSDQPNQGYVAVLTGDVNGSWVYTSGAKSLENTLNLKAGSAETPSAALSIGEFSGETGGQAVVQLHAEVEALQAVTDLRILFDPSVLRVHESSGVTPGTPLAGWTLLANTAERPGLIRLSASASAPVSAQGPIVEILFDVIGPPGATTPLHLVGGVIENASGEIHAAAFQSGSFAVHGPVETPVYEATPLPDETLVPTPSPISAVEERFDAVSLLELIRAVADKETTGESSHNLFEFADRWMEPTR